MDYYQFNWHDTTRLENHPQKIGYQSFKLYSISEEYTNNINKSRYVAFSLSNCTIQICDLSTGYNFLNLNDHVQ